MSNCPICSGNTLRHIRNGRVYWYCHHCYQEVPDFAQLLSFRTIRYEDDLIKQTQPLVGNCRS